MSKRAPLLGLVTLLGLILLAVWPFISPAPRVEPLAPFPRLQQQELEIETGPEIQVPELEIESVPVVDLPPLGDPGFTLSEEEFLILTMASVSSNLPTSGDFQSILTGMNTEIDALVEEMEGLTGPMTDEQEIALRRWLVTGANEAIHEQVVRDLVAMGFPVDKLDYKDWVGWNVRATRIGLVSEVITRVMRMDENALQRAKEAEPQLWNQLMSELETLTLRQPIGEIGTDTNILWKSFWELSQRHK